MNSNLWKAYLILTYDVQYVRQCGESIFRNLSTPKSAKVLSSHFDNYYLITDWTD